MWFKRKSNNQNRQETYSSQLCELWKSCSKKWICIVVILSVLTAIITYAVKVSLDYGRDIDQIWYLLEWDSCIAQFFILYLFIWVLLLNKKVFSPKNNNNRASRFKMAFDRIISQGHFIQFYWLVSIFILLLVLLSALMGTFDAFGMFPVDNNLNWNPLSLTYLLLTDTSTISSILKTNTHIANALVILCVVVSVLGTLLFTGLLVSVFSNFLQRRVDDYKNGRLHYDQSDHIVFIGYDEILPSLVKQCAEYEANRNRKIVVQTKLLSEQVRDDIKTLITDDSLLRNIVFYNGRRDSIKDLRILDLQRASEVFVIGNRQNDNHDELNLQCLGHIQEIINESNEETDKKSKVFLLIEDHTEYSKMKFLWDNEEKIKVSLFNVYAIWAKALIHNKYEYPKLALTEKKEAEGINIIIVGMSKFGSSIGIEAINNFKRKKVRTIITYVCENAVYEMDMLKARFSELFDHIKCTFNNLVDTPTIYDINKKTYSETLSLEIEFIESNPFNKNLYIHIGARKMKKYIFFCSDKNTNDLNGALFMPQKFLLNSYIYILQKYGTEFINKLKYYNNLYTFGSQNPSLNLYQFLLENSFDLVEKYDNLVETANIFENQGDWNAAIDYRYKAFQICKKEFGEDSIKFAEDNIELGLLYERIDDYETAGNFLNVAFKIFKNKYGYDSLEIAHLEMIIGWCLVYQADYYQWSDNAYYAEECFGRAKEIYEKKLGKDSQEVQDASYGISYSKESQMK